MENQEEIFAQLIDFLKQTVDIPDEEIGLIEERVKILFLKKGEHFIRAGEVPKKASFVYKGLMREYNIDEKGNDFTKHFHLDFAFASSHAAFIEQRESFFSIDALEDTILFTLDYDNYNKFLQGHPCWLKIYYRALERVFILKDRREGWLKQYDAKKKYIQFLKDFPGLEKRVKQYHIASYLGISPVSLSRLRNTYSQEK